MKVWIHLNGVQEGPYELEQLPLGRMDASTPVWYEGLADWTPAGQASVTAPYFSEASSNEGVGNAWASSALGAESSKQSHEEQPKCPPSYLAWSIAMTILCCNPLGIVPIITGAGTRSKFNSRDYQGAEKMSEVTAWLVMILIVTCLMVMPFAMVII